LPRLSNDPKDADKIYFSVMRCPKCGYETTVTNVCRQCPKTAPTEEANRPVWCDTHKCFHHLNGKHYMHQSVNMIVTGKVSRINPKTGRRMTRHYQGKPDELGKLWCGWGVVFDD